MLLAVIGVTVPHRVGATNLNIWSTPMSRTTKTSPFLARTLAAATLVGGITGVTSLGAAANNNCDKLTEHGDHEKTEYPNLWSTHVSVTTTNIHGVDVTLEGSGVMVSPYSMLLPANMLYERGDLGIGLDLAPGEFIGSKSQYTITPAISKSWNGEIIAPFGTRTPSRRAISSDFKTCSKTKAKYKFNWGCLQFDCPFEGMGSGMPIKFKSLNNFNPKPVEVIGFEERNLKLRKTQRLENEIYHPGNHRWAIRVTNADFRNVLGGSGVSRTTSRDLIGLITQAQDGCTARGPRFNDVGNRMNSIKELMQYKPAEDCANEQGATWLEVLGVVLGTPEMMIPMEELNITNGNEELEQTQHSSRTMQVIEHTFYEWLEYQVIPGPLGEAGPRAIKMLQPEERWLDQNEAQALLSASANWSSFNRPVENPETFSVDPTIEVASSLITGSFGDAFEGPDQSEAPMDWLEAADEDDAPQFDPSDINQDGAINGADLAELLGNWDNQGTTSDLDGNGIVDGGDLTMLLARWQ